MKNYILNFIGDYCDKSDVMTKMPFKLLLL